MKIPTLEEFKATLSGDKAQLNWRDPNETSRAYILYHDGCVTELGIENVLFVAIKHVERKYRSPIDVHYVVSFVKGDDESTEPSLRVTRITFDPQNDILSWTAKPGAAALSF